MCVAFSSNVKQEGVSLSVAAWGGSDGGRRRERRPANLSFFAGLALARAKKPFSFFAFFVFSFLRARRKIETLNTNEKVVKRNEEGTGCASY